MKPTKSIYILLSLFLIFSCQGTLINNSEDTLLCDDGLTNVDGECIFVCEEGVTECYYQGDLDVLQDIIDVNESLSGEEPLGLGGIGGWFVKWTDGRVDILRLQNQLTTLPESIGNLSSLEVFDLFYNQLTFFPESIGNLSSLEWLWAWNNQLTSLPQSICNLPEDCSIWVMDNQLCEEYHYDCIDSWGTQDCGD